MTMARPSVAAVVVTFNRKDVLRGTLAAVAAQTVPPGRVFVVDNGGQDGTKAMVDAEFPSVLYVRMRENLGFAAGLAEGMRRSVVEGFDFAWLLDDDSSPAPSALEGCLSVATMTPNLGAVGLSGGMLPRGVPDRRPHRRRPYGGEGATNLYRCDFVLLDGAIVPQDAILDVGYPRGDFFMMYEDVEYTGRLGRAGRALVLLDEDLIDRGHLGSGGDSADPSAPPWRGYYQSRNHLLTARSVGTFEALLGWGLRQLKLMTGALLFGDHKLTRLRLRALGAWHGARGVTGRTIDPPARTAPR